MRWREECLTVIPCLNEESHIALLVGKVRRFFEQVLVIDDGSSDDTATRARAAGAVVVRHPTTQGKGAALRTGWGWGRERGFVWALCLDGDGQHAPEDIPLFLTCAESTGATLVVGNRLERPGPMPWVRRATNRFMSWQLSRLAGQPLADTQCGYRLMQLGVWSELDLKTNHFEVESELLLAFARAGQPIAFVPIQVIYGRQRSRIRALRDTWRWWRWLRRSGR